jgi:hypothetical protein
MGSFGLKKLNKIENIQKVYKYRKYRKYRIEIPNRFAVLENLDTEVDINRAWETI